MRKKIIIGNWKMNKGIRETIDFLDTFSNYASTLDSSKVIAGVAPTFLCLPSAVKYSDKVVITAQDCIDVPSGAYTGMISAKMLIDEGIKWCLVGHSERRTYANETNEKCTEKLATLFNLDMHAIYCVGESIDDFEKGNSKRVIHDQIKEGLNKISDIKNLVIAYEPVWSIGTGKSASKEIAQEMCQYIRSIIKELYGDEAADNVLIQYGGSVKPNNVFEYISQPDIDGVLVGGASLECNEFIDLINKSL